MNTENYLASNLKLFREVNLITQENLAQEFYVGRLTIHRWEKGECEPDINSLLKLADRYQVSVVDLVRKDFSKTISSQKVPERRIIERMIDQMKSKRCALDEEYFMFPKVLPEKDSQTNRWFFEAAELDCNKSFDADARCEMVHKYWEAFEMGSVDAGINLLRVMAIIHMAYHMDNNNEYPFQSRMEQIIAYMNEHGKSIGEYYEALALIYDLMESDMDEETAFDEGLILMYQLASNGNEYAEKYVSVIESADEE